MTTSSIPDPAPAPDVHHDEPIPQVPPTAALDVGQPAQPVAPPQLPVQPTQTWWRAFLWWLGHVLNLPRLIGGIHQDLEALAQIMANERRIREAVVAAHERFLDRTHEDAQKQLLEVRTLLDEVHRRWTFYESHVPQFRRARPMFEAAEAERKAKEATILTPPAAPQFDENGIRKLHSDA